MKKFKLKNGLPVLTIPLHETKALTVFVFAKVGSRYEAAPINGASHFIEHLMFKGTKRRPTTLSISKQLDGVGANYNAFTSKDSTGYYVKINHEKTDLALDILSDMVQNSTFDSKEIARERGVIVEEISMYEDNPVMSIDDVFESAIFGDHHPLGWNIAGPREVIRKISRAKLLRFRHQHYHANNMWLVMAGRMPDNIQALAEQYFGSFPKKAAQPKPTKFAPKGQTPTVRIRYKEGEQIQMGLGTCGLSYTDPRLPILSVLSIILGGNMSSRLFIQVRERRGLAYSVHAAVNPYEDTGSFMIQAGLEKSRLPEALQVMVGELKKMKAVPVTAAELKRAKEYVRGKMILDIEDSDALASWYGRQALFYRQIQSPEEALARITKVTAADVQRLARHLFRSSAMRLAIIGPFKDGAPFAKIIRRV